MTTRHHPMEPRQRRHTINRPASIQEQLPEAHDEEQTFERISGILSTLLQEANNAVNAVECQQTPRWMQKKGHGDMMIQSLQPISKQISPIDLPRNANNLEQQQQQQQHSNDCGNDSTNSSSSSSTTTSSSSPELSPSSQSSSSSTTSLDSTTTTLLWRKGSATIKNITHPTMNSSSARYRGALLRGSLVESYKRLDHSMAMVDSLSRDLASSDEQDAADEDKQHNDDDQETSIFVNGKSPPSFHNESNNNNNITTTMDLRLSAFLVAPFLHFPQALISWVFDSLSNNRDSSSHLTGMLAWCFFFAFANIMVDQAAAGLPVTKMGRYSRNVPVPGSYHSKVHRISSIECVSTTTSSLFRRRSARRAVVIPRRSSIYRKYYSGTTTRWVSPTIMHHAKTITPCRRINNNSSSIRMHPSHRRPHSLAITRSHTQPPLLDITISSPLVASPLITTLSSIPSSSSSSSSSLSTTITRRNSF